MDWYNDLTISNPGIGDTYPDPADPINDNKIMVLCKAGVYTFGVIADYHATPRDWPRSFANCVVEIK